VTAPGRATTGARQRPFRVGLTGGIASGKSTVARLFAELGVPVIDTDEIARQVATPGTPALAEIVAAFGPQFLDPSGALDRRRLRLHVFGDAARRRHLESILHPRIEAAALEASARAGGAYQVLVVPLLIESGFDRHTDRVLVVDCPEETQRARLLTRDRETPEQVERMLAAQLDRRTRLTRADDVIVNDGSLDDIRREVRRLHSLYQRLAAESRPPDT
jgi:dephospho-CoA kinase